MAVDACGLCGSDVHSLASGQTEEGQILGHEFSGRIAALGRDVTGWAEGEPVAASPLGSCGECRICARGLNFRCPAAPNIGITRPGAYAEYVAVPARQLVRLPPEVPVERGSHAEPLSVAMQAVCQARIGPGDPVLVYGTGPIGLYAIMALRLAGAGPIVAAGRSEGRRKAARDVGADVVLDTRSQPAKTWVEEHDTKFAAVLECSAAPQAFEKLLPLIEPGGTAVEVALTPEEARVPLFHMLSEGLHLVGSCAFSDSTYREVVDHLVNDRVPAERLISERVSLADTPDALVRLRTPAGPDPVKAQPVRRAMKEFAGRTAVVTGAGSGMGKAFALRFAAEGMNVMIGDIQDDALAATVNEIKAANGNVTGLHTDVSKLEDVQALADAAEEHFGPVHLVCNNAGVEGYLDGPVWEATGKDWEWTVSVNFWSAVHGVRTFVPRMLAHGQEAHVVNTCSMTSVVRATNLYGITKHAVIALSEVLHEDLKKARAPIGVTALCPGTIATNLFRGSRNRPPELTDEGGNISPSGQEIRDRMHGVLAGGMPPSEVADKLVAKIRSGQGLYLLTDHEWDDQVIQRHEEIMASAVGPGGGGT